MGRNYDVITFLSKYLYFKKTPRVANFTGIHKIASMLLKQTLINQKKLKELEIMY